MNNQPQLQKAKNSAAFKVPNIDMVWHPSTGDIMSYGIEAVAETFELKDGKYEPILTTRWFSEKELKDAVFIDYSVN